MIAVLLLLLAPLSVKAGGWEAQRRPNGRAMHRRSQTSQFRFDKTFLLRPQVDAATHVHEQVEALTEEQAEVSQARTEAEIDLRDYRATRVCEEIALMDAPHWYAVEILTRDLGMDYWDADRFMGDVYARHLDRSLAVILAPVSQAPTDTRPNRKIDRLMRERRAVSL